VRSLGACDALALTPAHPRLHQSTNISTPTKPLCVLWMPERRVGTDPSRGRGTQAYVPMALGTFVSLLS
jgi:hypothetical protein